MRDDAGIIEFSDHPIGHVACALTRSARQEHDVRDLERMTQPFAQRGDVVMRDAKPQWLATQFLHGVGQNLRVGIIDLGRLHRIAGRDDLVAG